MDVVRGTDPVADARQLAYVLIRQPSLHRCMQLLLLLSDRDVLQCPVLPIISVSPKQPWSASKTCVQCMLSASLKMCAVCYIWRLASGRMPDCQEHRHAHNGKVQTSFHSHQSGFC